MTHFIVRGLVYVPNLFICIVAYQLFGTRTPDFYRTWGMKIAFFQFKVPIAKKLRYFLSLILYFQLGSFCIFAYSKPNFVSGKEARELLSAVQATKRSWVGQVQFQGGGDAASSIAVCHTPSRIFVGTKSGVVWVYDLLSRQAIVHRRLWDGAIVALNCDSTGQDLLVVETEIDWGGDTSFRHYYRVSIEKLFETNSTAKDLLIKTKSEFLKIPDALASERDLYVWSDQEDVVRIVSGRKVADAHQRFDYRTMALSDPSGDESVATSRQNCVSFNNQRVACVENGLLAWSGSHSSENIADEFSNAKFTHILESSDADTINIWSESTGQAVSIDLTTFRTEVEGVVVFTKVGWKRLEQKIRHGFALLLGDGAFVLNQALGHVASNELVKTRSLLGKLSVGNSNDISFERSTGLQYVLGEKIKAKVVYKDNPSVFVLTTSDASVLIDPENGWPIAITPFAGQTDSRIVDSELLTLFGRDVICELLSNGGIRIFDISRKKMLGILYILDDGRDFILLTEGGFFASGNGAAKNLERLKILAKGTSFSMSGFYDVFYRPDIVLAVLKGDDRYLRTMGSFGADAFESAMQKTPPRITMQVLGEFINSKRVKVSYTITPDTGGVAEVRIFQNGKLISSDGTYKDAPGKAYAPVAGKSVDAGLYAEANLQRNAKRIEESNGKTNTLRDQLIVRGAPEKKCTPGKSGNPCKGDIDVEVIPGEENTITVVAFNRDNTIQSVPASVSFKSTLPKEDPHLWVIGVGIDQFANISALKNAHKDAQDFICTYAGKEQVSKIGVACAEDGKAKTLFKPQNIHVVDALFDAQATKSNILTALDKVASQAKPGDTFVWFVASHGMMDANSNFGIIAHDTQCLNDNCTDIKGHLTSNEILEASKKIKAMKQLVVLDTCHSGGLDSKLSGLYDARVSLLAKNMGLHLYASAQATEAAQDGKPGTNGTFTAQLLEGIKGAAPKNQEGQISVMTLGDYAKQKTIEVTQPKSGTKDARPAQTPVIQHFGQDAGLVAVGRR